MLAGGNTEFERRGSTHTLTEELQIGGSYSFPMTAADMLHEKCNTPFSYMLCLFCKKA